MRTIAVHRPFLKMADKFPNDKDGLSEATGENNESSFTTGIMQPDDIQARQQSDSAVGGDHNSIETEITAEVQRDIHGMSEAPVRNDEDSIAARIPGPDELPNDRDGLGEAAGGVDEDSFTIVKQGTDGKAIIEDNPTEESEPGSPGARRRAFVHSQTYNSEQIFNLTKLKKESVKRDLIHASSIKLVMKAQVGKAESLFQSELLPTCESTVTSSGDRTRRIHVSMEITPQEHQLKEKLENNPESKKQLEDLGVTLCDVTLGCLLLELQFTTLKEFQMFMKAYNENKVCKLLKDALPSDLDGQPITAVTTIAPEDIARVERYLTEIENMKSQRLNRPVRYIYCWEKKKWYWFVDPDGKYFFSLDTEVVQSGPYGGQVPQEEFIQAIRDLKEYNPEPNEAKTSEKCIVCEARDINSDNVCEKIIPSESTYSSETITIEVKMASDVPEPQLQEEDSSLTLSIHPDDVMPSLEGAFPEKEKTPLRSVSGQQGQDTVDPEELVKDASISDSTMEDWEIQGLKKVLKSGKMDFNVIKNIETKRDEWKTKAIHLGIFGIKGKLKGEALKRALYTLNIHWSNKSVLPEGFKYSNPHQCNMNVWDINETPDGDGVIAKGLFEGRFPMIFIVLDPDMGDLNPWIKMAGRALDGNVGVTFISTKDPEPTKTQLQEILKKEHFKKVDFKMLFVSPGDLAHEVQLHDTLMDGMFHCFPTAVFQQTVYQVKATNPSYIGLKSSVLRNRIWRTALLAIMNSGAEAVPGTSVTCNLDVLVDEAKFYFANYHLGDSEIMRMFIEMDPSLAKIVEGTNKEQEVDKAYIIEILKESQMPGSWTLSYFPGVYIFVSYRACYNTLNKILDIAAKNASELLTQYAEKV